MKPTITIDSMQGPLGEYLLVSVVNGMGIIGVCDTSTAPRSKRETFYIGPESLLNVYSSSQDNTALRQIWQCSTIDKCPAQVKSVLTSCIDEFFFESVSLSMAVRPVLDYLCDGLYVIHANNVYPSDGAGNFFWNAYLMRHELNGSAPSNPVFGQEKNFSPPFIVPTQACTACNEKGITAASSRLKRGRRIGGIAYHLSGMFSALMAGHINAAACLAKDIDFPCIIIEPLRGVSYSADEITGAERITGLSCPYVSVPINTISRSMIECFLMNRRSSVPEFYPEIRERADKVLQIKGASREIPPYLPKHAERLPDAEMLASAFAVSELSEEQIQLLLSGETKLNDKVIISQNYYESIVYACNFLQYTSQERFIDFTVQILNNPALSATYRYVAERLRYTMDARVNETFTNIQNSEEAIYIPVKEIAKRYIKRYSEHMEQSVNNFLDDDSDVPPALSLSAPTPAPEKSSAPPGTGFSSMALKQEMEKAARK